MKATQIIDTIMRALRSALPGMIRAELAPATGELVGTFARSLSETAGTFERSLAESVATFQRSIEATAVSLDREREARQALTEQVRSIARATEEFARAELLERLRSVTIGADEHGFLMLEVPGIVRAPLNYRPFAYCGAYDETRAYETNDAVTARGSLWIARTAVMSGIAPGTDAAAGFWTLAVKCGKDGRHGSERG